MAMLENEVYSATGDTLSALRAIRATVEFGSESDGFPDDLANEARALVEGIVSAFFLMAREEALRHDLENLLNMQMRKAQAVYRRANARQSYDRLGSTDQVFDSCVGLAHDPHKWVRMMQRNNYEENLAVSDNTLIVSPLSSGPIVVRLVQRLLENDGIVIPPVALAVVESTRSQQERIGRTRGYNEENYRKVYLPTKTSWPETEIDIKTTKVLILDDLSSSGRVQHEMANGIRRNWGIYGKRLIGQPNDHVYTG